MLKTRLCALFGIEHPVALGGMGIGTNPELVAAVSNAGGLGIQGCSRHQPERITELAAAIRARTDRPFGLNLLLFLASEAQVAAALAARPAVLSTAWPRADQDLAGLFQRAHDAGVSVLHMVSTVAEARRAADSGADAIVAQGTEGGGHVGLMGTMVLVPMVARAVAPIPVLAAGGLADGAGLAAALMLGAEGALYGTRFLATPEASVPVGYKQVIIDSDGHNTVVTEIPDVANGTVWPGAYARVERNRFIQTWVGREGELRYRQAEAATAIRRSYETGDTDDAVLYTGQTAGLIDELRPAATVVAQIMGDATALLRERAPSLLAAMTRSSYEVEPIGWVESPLVDPDAAPKQGYEGSPDAWLVFNADVGEGIRDLRIGSEVIVLTWLDRARRDVLVVHPRDDLRNPETGVFSTRSQDRPNPVGLHRVQIVAISGLRVRVRDLEALDGTPIVDVKPVLDRTGEC